MNVRDAPNEQPLPPRPPVSVRGRGDGLRIVVRDGGREAIIQSLREQLEKRAGSFFAGAAVRLELPAGPLDMGLASEIAAVVDEAGMELVSVTTEGPVEKPTRVGRNAPETMAPVTGALVVRGTVRAGQRIMHDGDIVVIGDVNPGSEIIAGGNVVVWGRLRGIVEAGLAEGVENPVVCALDLAPTQLQIGRTLARAPEEPDRQAEPEVARQFEGRIVVDAWR